MMKMLTIHRDPAATADDFCWGIEGEVALPGTALPGTVCSTPNPECGCERSHGGINSHKASTTLMVRDLDLTLDDLTAGCVGYLAAAGYAALARDADEVDSLAYSMILEAAGVAARHPVGTVLRMVFSRDSEQWHYRAAKAAQR
jgi:hypothetical protein